MTWRLVVGVAILMAAPGRLHAVGAFDGPVLIHAVPTPDDPALRRAVDALKHGGVDQLLPAVIAIDPDQYPGLPLSGKVAFRLRDRASGALDPQIYVNRASRMYRLAVENDQVGIAMFAASLVHELAHDNGGGDSVAYAAEAAFLRRYLGTQNLKAQDRENLEFNLVHVDDLQRIEAHRVRLAQARSARHTP